MSGFSAVTYVLAKKASKQYADYLFSKVGALDIQFVDSLPTVDIKEKTIYFVPASAEKTSYNQYMYVDSNWVLVGSTELNLDNYYTKDELKKEIANILPIATEDKLGAIIIDNNSILIEDNGKIHISDNYIKNLISKDYIQENIDEVKTVKDELKLALSILSKFSHCQQLSDEERMLLEDLLKSSDEIKEVEV